MTKYNTDMTMYKALNVPKYYNIDKHKYIFVGEI